MKKKQVATECSNTRGGVDRYITWQCDKCLAYGSTAEEVYIEGDKHCEGGT